MKILRILLDREIERLKLLDLDEESGIESALDMMNESPYMLTLHGLERYNFKVLLNDNKRQFYGFKENDQSSKNMMFYLSTIHPTTTFTYIKAQQFFHRNDLGYMEMEYLLRNYFGKFEKNVGVTRTIRWNDEGIPSFALSLTCRKSEYSQVVARHVFQLDGLTKREDETFSKLISGLSNSEIAHQLGISERTVEKHVSSILKQSGLKNRAALFASLNQSL